uniref:Mitochondrial ATP synthase regulatory component factor B n=1 Tax=Acrobeloides nanus TaxID=290746 RepID=A0A914EPM5_9BILA
MANLIREFSYDKKRVNEVGPDRAAAEWIVRCEGKIKFDKFKDYISDYNDLVRITAMIDPAKPAQQVYLEAIDASDAIISGYGSYYFRGLKHLHDVKFIRCRNWPDWGFEIMGDAVGEHVKNLRIESCPKISEKGIRYLTKFSALKTLTLLDLELKNKDQLLQELEQALPSCDIKSPFC